MIKEQDVSLFEQLEGSPTASKDCEVFAGRICWPLMEKAEPEEKPCNDCINMKEHLKAMQTLNI